jgi:hypothetical protein
MIPDLSSKAAELYLLPSFFVGSPIKTFDLFIDDDKFSTLFCAEIRKSSLNNKSSGG